MKEWYSISCVVCGFCFPPEKFTTTLAPIEYPLQLVTGGGRAKGFTVSQRIAWAGLSSLDPTSDVMRTIGCEYVRLAEAYDNFHFYLGYLSPAMKALIDSLRKEIFGLHTEVHMLTNRNDRFQFLNMIRKSDEVGDVKEIISRIQERERQEARGREELLTGLQRQTRDRHDQRSAG